MVKPLRDGCDVITMGMFDFLLDEYSLAGIWKRGGDHGEFIIEFIRVSEMRPISVNGETTVNHVNERARESTFHLLSGSSASA